MSVIVGMDMPNRCYDCELRKGCNCIIKKMYLPDLSVQNQDCPLKSVEGLIEKIKAKEYAYISSQYEWIIWNNALEEAIKIIEEYFEVEASKEGEKLWIKTTIY